MFVRVYNVDICKFKKVLLCSNNVSHFSPDATLLRKLKYISKMSRYTFVLFLGIFDVIYMYACVWKEKFNFQRLHWNSEQERRVDLMQCHHHYTTHHPWDIKRKSSLKCKIFNDFFSYILFSPTSHLPLCRPFLQIG